MAENAYPIRNDSRGTNRYCCERIGKIFEIYQYSLMKYIKNTVKPR